MRARPFALGVSPCDQRNGGYPRLASVASFFPISEANRLGPASESEPTVRGGATRRADFTPAWNSPLSGGGEPERLRRTRGNPNLLDAAACLRRGVPSGSQRVHAPLHATGSRTAG